MTYAAHTGIENCDFVACQFYIQEAVVAWETMIEPKKALFAVAPRFMHVISWHLASTCMKTRLMPPVMKLRDSVC